MASEFQRLWEQAHKAHDAEVEALTAELQALRMQLGYSQGEAGAWATATLSGERSLKPPACSSDASAKPSGPDPDPSPFADGCAAIASPETQAGNGAGPIYPEGPEILRRESSGLADITEEQGSCSACSSSSTQSDETTRQRLKSAKTASAGFWADLTLDGDELEPSKYGIINKLRALVNSKDFQTATAILIAVGCLFLCVEGQCDGIALASSLSLPPEFHERQCPGWLLDSCVLVDSCLGLAFTVEVILIVTVHPKHFLQSGWNWVDLLISVSWWTTLFDFLFDGRAVRFARILKMLRLLRFVRATKILQSDVFFLMVTAISNSIKVTLWAALLLVLILAAIALICRQLLEDYFLQSESDPAVQSEVFTYFGTFARAVFTMFELTLANWPPVARYMSENVTQWFALFALVHKMTMGFAVVGVVNGVFMQETFKAAAADDRIMVSTKRRQMDTHKKKMNELFSKADPSGHGTITREAFRHLVSQPQVKIWLASMELDCHDADNLFTLLNNGSDRITADDLVAGSARLRGPARSIDVASLLFAHRNLEVVFFQHIAGLAERFMVGEPQSDRISHLLELNNLPSCRSSVRQSIYSHRESRTSVDTLGWGRSGSLQDPGLDGKDTAGRDSRSEVAWRRTERHGTAPEAAWRRTQRHGTAPALVGSNSFPPPEGEVSEVSGSAFHPRNEQAMLRARAGGSNAKNTVGPAENTETFTL